jgi:hypothetical protein
MKYQSTRFERSGKHELIVMECLSPGDLQKKANETDAYPFHGFKYMLRIAAARTFDSAHRRKIGF